MHAFAPFLLVLLWITSLVPSSSSWSATFLETADAIATACEERPVFGSWRACAAVLTSIGKFESDLDPNVCERLKGKLPNVCDGGASVGIWQINRSFHPPPDIHGQAKLAAKLADESDRICHGRPLAERLTNYAHGRGVCPREGDAVEKSRHRMQLAARLLKP